MGVGVHVYRKLVKKKKRFGTHKYCLSLHVFNATEKKTSQQSKFHVLERFFFFLINPLTSEMSDKKFSLTCDQRELGLRS